MSSSFQNEIPKARVNLKLDLHTGGGQKKVELPLKLLVAGDFSNGQEERPLSERVKTDINKNNINDSWEKLAHAACIDPIGAFSSVSISSFQIMGKYY